MAVDPPILCVPPLSHNKFCRSIQNDGRYGLFFPAPGFPGADADYLNVILTVAVVLKVPTVGELVNHFR